MTVAGSERQTGMSSVRAYGLLLSGLVFCPCHLPVLTRALPGTALGAFLSQHAAAILVGSAVYSFAAVVIGYRMLPPTR